MIKQLLYKFKKALFLKQKNSIIVKEIECPHEWYGNDYGGFYVYPATLNSNSVVYSFGVGEHISFDRTLIEKHQCHIYAFDPTPRSIDWVRKQSLPSGFTFFDYGIHTQTGHVNFNLPKNKGHVSGSTIKHDQVSGIHALSVPMKSFVDITNELAHHHIDILKMDIEGSEYEIIDDVLFSPVQIDQLLLEIHERFFPNGKSKTRKLLKSLKRNGYALFAISDSQQELSFIHKTALKKETKV